MLVAINILVLIKVTTHVVRLKVFRLKTEGEREPKEFFSGIKQLQ